MDQLGWEWTRGESNPRLYNANVLYYHCTTSPRSVIIQCAVRYGDGEVCDQLYNIKEWGAKLGNPDAGSGIGNCLGIGQDRVAE